MARGKRGVQGRRALEIALGVGLVAAAAARWGLDEPPQASLQLGLFAAGAALLALVARRILAWVGAPGSGRRTARLVPAALAGSGVLLALTLLPIPVGWPLALTAAGATVLLLLGAPDLARMAARLVEGRRGRGPRLSPAGAARPDLPDRPMRRADLQRISPRAFEQLCARIGEHWGYQSRVIGEAGDGGIDVIMRRPERWIVAQCKRYRGTVPVAQVREFYGAFIHAGADEGIFFTTGRFSQGAYDFVRGKPIRLVDGSALEKLLAALDESGDGSARSSRSSSTTGGSQSTKTAQG